MTHPKPRFLSKRGIVFLVLFSTAGGMVLGAVAEHYAEAFVRQIAAAAISSLCCGPVESENRGQNSQSAFEPFPGTQPEPWPSSGSPNRRPGLEAVNDARR